jgi:hypothetical protein
MGALSSYGSKVVHKEMYLTDMEIRSMNPEQLAMVDLLVLVHAKRFVGLSASAFSTYVREYRHVMRIADRNTATLVQAGVGTEDMLSKCATLL